MTRWPCNDRLVEAGRGESDFAEAARLVNSARPSPVFFDYWSDMDERLWRFLIRKQDHDPMLDALRLHCPHLAIFGAADELVPVPDSIHLFSTIMCHPHRQHRAPLTIEVFPGANHRIQTHAGTKLAAGYLDTLTTWIKARQHHPG